MQPQSTTSFLSVDDYLEGESGSQVRHEYMDGEIYSMVGASARHGLITLNVGGLLSQRLPDRCQVFSSDMKVRIQTDERDVFYFYQCLDTLEEYVLVSQDYRQVEVFRRAEQWKCTRYTEGEVPLQSVELTLIVDEIYRRTDR